MSIPLGHTPLSIGGGLVRYERTLATLEGGRSSRSDVTCERLCKLPPACAPTGDMVG